MEGAAAAVGVIGFGLHAIHTLLEDIDQIRETPEVLRLARQDLQAVQTILHSLSSTLKQSEALPDTLRQSLNSVKLEQTVISCQTSCSVFQLRLRKWTKHSQGAPDPLWWERVRIGLFGEAKIRALRGNLATCKDTISMALDVANLSISIEKIGADEQMKKMMLQMREEQLKTRGSAVEQQVAEVESQRQQLSVVSATEERISSQENAAVDERQRQSLEEVQRDLADHLTLLRNQQSLAAQFIAALHQERTGVRIEDIKFADGGQGYVGVFNTDMDRFKTSLDVKGVNVGSNSKGVVGIGSNVDLTGFMAR